ncbi:MAG: hypothetical protein ABIT10_14030 [Alteraurantiacibacter sp.]
MADLRIEYFAAGVGAPQRHSVPVPDVQTALIVAQMNSPDGEVELWEGETQLARLHRQQGDLSPLWRVM